LFSTLKENFILDLCAEPHNGYFRSKHVNSLESELTPKESKGLISNCDCSLAAPYKHSLGFHYREENANTCCNSKMQDFKTNSTKNEKFHVTLIKIAAEPAAPQRCVETRVAAAGDPSEHPRRSLPPSPCGCRFAADLRSQSLLISV